MVHGYRSVWVLVVVTSLVLSIPPAFAAECEHTSAKIALHLLSPVAKAISCGLADISCSSEGALVVSGDLDQDYIAYVFLTDWSGESGVQQVQIGANYDATEGSGVDVVSFHSCATFTTSPIGPWPEPGSELMMTWDSCQVPSGDKMLMLGQFELVAHTPGIFSVAKVFAPGAHTVPRLVDCGGVEKLIEPNTVSQLGFGASQFSFDTCTGWIDVYPGPCCMADSCSYTGLACCWANGGVLLDYMSTCAQCVAPVVPKTWGQLKARYE